MRVMQDGFERVIEVPYGPVDAVDISEMRGTPILGNGCATACGDLSPPEKQEDRANVFSLSYFQGEYRAGLGYHQPASPLAAVGVVAAAAGAKISKYVARRETPVFVQENCTQCMECISICPDTALPNTAQELDTVLSSRAPRPDALACGSGLHYSHDPPSESTAAWWSDESTTPAADNGDSPRTGDGSFLYTNIG